MSSVVIVVLSEVGQGTYLEPTLFQAFIYDISNIFEFPSHLLFVDNLNFY